MDLPTAIQAADSEEEQSADEAVASEPESEQAAEASQIDSDSGVEEKPETDENPEASAHDSDTADSGEDEKR
jgi:hypothetical protein